MTKEKDALIENDAMKFCLFSEETIMKKDGRNEESKLPIYRHRQQRQDCWIKSKPKSTTRITHINEEMVHVGIKGAVSRKRVLPPHALYSSEMRKIFPEKMAQKARHHFP